MTKFNEIQKKWRAQVAESKRNAHGDPLTRKLKQKPQPVTISGKRKRKLFKKWRRDQKEALRTGSITMEDVEMAVAQGDSKDTTKSPKKFHMKKSPKLNFKQLKRKGKKQKSSSGGAVEVSVDAMVE